MDDYNILHNPKAEIATEQSKPILPPSTEEKYKKLKYYVKVFTLFLCLIGGIYMAYVRTLPPKCEYGGLFTTSEMSIVSFSAPKNITQTISDGFEVKVLCSDSNNSNLINTTNKIFLPIIQTNSVIPNDPNGEPTPLYQFYESNTCKNISKYLVTPTRKVNKFPTTVCYSGAQ